MTAPTYGLSVELGERRTTPWTWFKVLHPLDQVSHSQARYNGTTRALLNARSTRANSSGRCTGVLVHRDHRTSPATGTRRDAQRRPGGRVAQQADDSQAALAETPRYYSWTSPALQGGIRSTPLAHPGPRPDPRRPDQSILAALDAATKGKHWRGQVTSSPIAFATA